MIITPGRKYVIVLLVPTLTVVLYVCSNTQGICALRMPPTVDHLQFGVFLTVHLPLCPRHSCTKKTSSSNNLKPSAAPKLDR